LSNSGKAAQQQSSTAKHCQTAAKPLNRKIPKGSKRQSRSAAKRCQTAAKPLNSKAQSGKAAQPKSIVKQRQRRSTAKLKAAKPLNSIAAHVQAVKLYSVHYEMLFVPCC